MCGRAMLTILIILLGLNTQAQVKRYDSSMKLGKTGYRVTCSNKGADKNNATINPLGFENTAREVNVEIKGRITGAEVDDLNNDGFPDLVIYVFNGDKNKGSVLGVRSDKNQGLGPIFFPDIVDDPKLRLGYIGNDEFSLMEGTLMRRFPVYNTTDSANIKPSGIVRQVQYRVVPDEKGMQKFKVSRSYELPGKQ
ncbi:MAG: hypothetical protein JWQ78_1392 [Sediminibacterium sp.]|nr:hypothetical protein [Sediminibacterium sp.]